MAARADSLWGMTPKNTDTGAVFACISDANGILMYAGRHVDLPDALVSYAKAVGWSKASLRKNPNELTDFASGHTWYEFEAPPKNWENWTGNMGPDEYDDFCDAALSSMHILVDEAVEEALARLGGGAR